MMILVGPSYLASLLDTIIDNIISNIIGKLREMMAHLFE